METEADTETGGLPFRMEPGQRFAGKYLIERVLGTGAMGVVVAALHEQLGQTVAIKLLSAPKDVQPEAIGRFFREARAAAALRSEHTARVVDVGIDELDRHFIVMEHLEGEDLGAVLRTGAPRALATSVGYVLHACEAIAEAHALGIVHRDLKPENLFLTRRMDGYPLVKVLDFGVSKMLEASVVKGALGDPAVSSSGSLVGTPLYMSPEQIRTPGSVDGRSDIWSLGVILYELVTGRRPFGGETIADVIASILVDSPPAPVTLRADIPTGLSEVIVACLEKDVERRVGNVGILAEGLRPWAPRWARDAAVRAARIAGERQLGADETGPYKTGTHTGTHDTRSTEFPVVPAEGPSPDPPAGLAAAAIAAGKLGARNAAEEAPVRPGRSARTPRAPRARALWSASGPADSRTTPTTAPGTPKRRPHLGWMALGFGSAVAASLVVLANGGPAVIRSHGTPAHERPVERDAPSPPAAEPRASAAAQGLVAPAAPVAAAPATPARASSTVTAGRSDTRAALPTTTGFVTAQEPGLGFSVDQRPRAQQAMTAGAKLTAPESRPSRAAGAGAAPPVGDSAPEHAAKPRHPREVAPPPRAHAPASRPSTSAAGPPPGSSPRSPGLADPLESRR